jgi:glycogen(starch) synthase
MRVSMIVPNSCAPDFRVSKEAESLAAAGHEVCIFCVGAPGLPTDEIRSGVRYQRLRWASSPPRVVIARLLRPRLGAGAGTTASAAQQTAEMNAVSAISAASVHPPGWMSQPIKRALWAWLRKQTETLYQPLIAASFGRVFGPALAASGADVIHAHDLHALPVAARVAARLGVAFVFDSHELEAHRNPPLTPARRRQVERLEARLLPQAAAVVTVSDSIADHIAAAYGIPRPLVLYNAPRLADQRDPKLPLPDLRQLAGAPENAYVLVHTGNVAPNRGLETAIDALALLKRDGRDCIAGRPICLIALGICLPGIASELAARARIAGVADRVFLLPPVAPEVVSRQIASADAALVPIIPVALSYQYAMPNKLFEAVMAGLPVIASDLTEMGAFLRRYNLGRTFPPGDAAALARVICANDLPAPPDPEVVASLCWERQAERLVGLYARLAELRRKENRSGRA